MSIAGLASLRGAGCVLALLLPAGVSTSAVVTVTGTIDGDKVRAKRIAP